MGDPRYILAEARGAVGLITLNRPEKLNAMNAQLSAELVQALDAFEADEAIRAIVLTGAGDRAFSAGADMREGVSRLHGAPVPAPGPSPTQRVRACAKPVLAAIRGYCYGGGANLAVCCDIRICAEDARFRFVGVTYGLPVSGAMLPRIVGEAKAKEILFTGDVVEAAEALRIGLANQVVPAAELLPYTLAIAARIAENSPAAVRALKVIVDTALPVAAAVERETALVSELRASAEHAARFRAAADRVVGRGSGSGSGSG